VSYNEQDDDDGKSFDRYLYIIDYFLDFIPIVDINKKTRNTKQPSRKQDEKSVRFFFKFYLSITFGSCRLSKHEDKEPELVLKHPEGSTIENPIMIEDKENSSSQSTVSSNGIKKLLLQQKIIDNLF
jgi:hypothetical protein